MNWDQIRELEKGGITIGIYGCKGRIITRTPLEEIEREIVESKSIFEKELERKVVYYGVTCPRCLYHL